MRILVIGGTRYFGIPMVYRLLENGHEITLATRGLTKDSFGNDVQRIHLDIKDANSVLHALKGKKYDVVIDKMGYSSNEIRNILEAVESDQFIHMSTAGVYSLDHMEIEENEFDGNAKELIWCDRGEFSYDETKQQAECALCQKYNDRNWAAVRYPFVIGKNDYTKRLLFYVDHVKKNIPMNINNLDSQICFVNEIEAGEFISFLVGKQQVGPVNGCSVGTISIREIIQYLEQKTGNEAMIQEEADPAPYNGTKSNSLSTKKARQMGFCFSDIRSWVYQLLDYLIAGGI